MAFVRCFPIEANAPPSGKKCKREREINLAICGTHATGNKQTDNDNANERNAEQCCVKVEHIFHCYSFSRTRALPLSGVCSRFEYSKHFYGVRAQQFSEMRIFFLRNCVLVYFGCTYG